MKSQTIPKQFQQIIDRVMEHDRKWFLANPDHDKFVRDLVPGEFGGEQLPDGHLTLVINFLGQMRLRMLVAEPVPSRTGFMDVIDPSGERCCVPVVRLFEGGE